MAEDIPITGPAGTTGTTTRRESAYETWPGPTLPPFPGITPSAMRRVSWGAILAGLVVALVVELALTMLGLAIGLGTINPATEANTFRGFGVGTGLWLAFTTFAALLCGGLTAGRLAGMPRRTDGILHGIVTWGLVTLLSTWILTSLVGQIVSGAAGVVGAGLGVVGQGVSALAPQALSAAGKQLQQQGVTPGTVGDEVNRFLRQTGDPALQPSALRREAQQAGQQVGQAAEGAVTQPQNAGDAIAAALSRVVAQGKGVINQVDRQDAINVIVARTGKSEAEAARIVDEWVTTWNNVTASVGQAAQQAGQTAAQVTENVSGALSQVALWSFLSMLLGVAGAAIGGSIGSPKEVPVAVASAATVSREH
jgi:hypothetical protein